MKATLGRLRAPSLPGNGPARHLASVPPPLSSTEYSFSLASLASRILYRSPLPSRADLPVYILNAAAFPDSKEVDYDALLPYVLARLPGEEELIGGTGYEVVFFAGVPAYEGNRARKASTAANEPGAADGGDAYGSVASGKGKKNRPGWGWFLQAYHVLTRAMRKRLTKLYVVHEKGWIRVVMEMFATIVSPKVRKKVVHVSTLSALAFHIPIEDLLIPPTAYMFDRQRVPDIFAPYASGRRAFGVIRPLLTAADGSLRLPRVLREATHFVLTEPLPNTDGLFRVSARAQTVEVLKEAFDRAQKFLVWKDGDAVLTFPHHKDSSGIVTIDDLEPIDGYDVHVAAALIKLWYHELREPILPISSYQTLEKLYNGVQDLPDDELCQLLSPNEADFSPFPPMSRHILRLHLLPTLSRIADHSDRNRMPPRNLATVFAPNIICGPDPIADMKMAQVLQRLLTEMIMKWKPMLAPALGCTDEAFEASLRLPEAVVDREDPLQETRGSATDNVAEQVSGISLQDNDHDSLEEDDLIDDDGNPPPLPPRPSTGNSTEDLVSSSDIPSPSFLRRPVAASSTDDLNSTSTSAINSVRRKPAPAVASLPRYSTVFGDRQTVLARIGSYNTGEHPIDTVSGVTGPNDHEEVLPAYEQAYSQTSSAGPSVDTSSSRMTRRESELADSPSSIPRKPVGAAKGEKEEKG